MERPDSTYPVAIKPYKLDLTQFGSKVRDSVSFWIANVSPLPVDLSLVDMADEYFEVKLPLTVAPGESGEATLLLKESALDQEFEKSFTFAIDDGRQGRFSVPVKRKLRPSIKRSPQTEDLGDGAESGKP